MTTIFLFKLFYIFQSSVNEHVLFLWYNNKINSSPFFKGSSGAGLGVKEAFQQEGSHCPSESPLRSYLPLPWLASLIPNLQHQLLSRVFNSSATEFLAFPCDLPLSAWQVPRPLSGHMYLCRLSLHSSRGYNEHRWHNWRIPPELCSAQSTQPCVAAQPDALSHQHGLLSILWGKCCSEDGGAGLGRQSPKALQCGLWNQTAQFIHCFFHLAVEWPQTNYFTSLLIQLQFL